MRLVAAFFLAWVKTSYGLLVERSASAHYVVVDQINDLDRAFDRVSLRNDKAFLGIVAVKFHVEGVRVSE